MKQDRATKKTLSINSHPAAAEKTRQWLLSQLNKLEYGDDDVFAVQLAFQEAFYNAMKHGNRMDAGKKVKIDFLIDPDRIEISMTDTGNGFNPDAVPDCRVGENLYKPEGRGLLLMRSYMDIVEFNEIGNSVHMVRFPRGAKSPASHTSK
jgi:serine/threonine-protein kinase RsbW